MTSLASMTGPVSSTDALMAAMHSAAEAAQEARLSRCGILDWQRMHHQQQAEHSAGQACTEHGCQQLQVDR